MFHRFLLVFLITFSLFPNVAAKETEVFLGDHKITGKIGYNGSNRNMINWLGIPYAEPPIGNLRWKAPRDFRGFTGNFDATVLPNRCAQVSNSYDTIIDGIDAGNIIGTEDCLYLNVYRPSEIDYSNEKLPVMFWIHGGGNTWGYSASELTTPKEFINKHNVILVSVNYRLGPFGWLAIDDLNKGSENALDQTNNFGTLDLIKALEWVNKNIEYFGGDKNNVTIFGESAGARNVMSLMITPQSKNLFHRAISQSGYLNSDTLDAAINKPRAGSNEFIASSVKNQYPEYSNSDLNDYISQTQKVEKLLRSLSTAEVISFYRVREGVGGLIDVPNVIPDGVVVPKVGLYKAFKSGLAHDVPIIFGTNRDEHKLFMFDNPEFVESKGFFFLENIFKELDFRYEPKDPIYYQAYSKYMSMSWKLGGADDPANILNQYNNSKVFNYRFDWDEEPTFIWTDYAKYLGASHGLEISFIFDTIDRDSLISNILYDDKNINTDQELADAIGKYWVNFAYSGNPNEGPYPNLISWNDWSKDIQRYLIFDSVNDQGIAMRINTDSSLSLLQNLSSEPITVDQKCLIVDRMLNVTTLTSIAVDKIYTNFLNGKCKK